MANNLLALTAIGIALAGCGAIADKRTAKAASEFQPTGQLIDIDGTTVHAHVEGNGPDLILIHGASGNTRDFTFDLVDRLSDRYRVIAFDRPGLGWTDRLPGKSGPSNTTSETPEEQAILLDAAAEVLGVERAVILGHSYGGAVALAWALERPEKVAGLTLVSAASQPWEGGTGTFYTIGSSRLGGAVVIPALAAVIPRSYVDVVLKDIFKPQTPPAGYAERIGAPLTLRPESLRANAQQIDALKPLVREMSPRYSSLHIPVEIVHGDADEIVPLEVHSRPLANQIPGANLTVLPGIGHMPHHVAPEAVTDAIDRTAARAALR
nr:alpha/beta hydrolase [Poseidonocella pacifica]